MEEIEDQPNAVVGKFLINAFAALVLFDTGALHSYISRGFVDKYNLSTVALKSPMLCLCRKEELFHMPHDSLNLMS